MAEVMFVSRGTLDFDLFALISDCLAEKFGVTSVILSLDDPKSYDRIKAKKPQLFRHVSEYDTSDPIRMMEAEKPKIVIVGNDYSYEKRSFVISGNYLRVPTLMVQNGTLEPGPRNSDPIAAITYNTRKLLFQHTDILRRYLLFASTLMRIERNRLRVLGIIAASIFREIVKIDLRGLYCTHIAVTAPFDKKILIGRGIESAKIEVTGYPLLDSLAKPLDYDVKKALKTTENRRIILLLTSTWVKHGEWSGEMLNAFVTSVFSALNDFSEQFQVVVKLHPHDDPERYRQCIDGNNYPFTLLRDVDLAALVRSSEIVVSGYSTAVLWALIADKPVVIVNLFGEKEWLPYVTSGAALGVYDSGELRRTISAALYDEETRAKLKVNRKKMVFELAYKTDGNATQRVAELIVNICKKK